MNPGNAAQQQSSAKDASAYYVGPYNFTNKDPSSEEVRLKFVTCFGDELFAIFYYRFCQKYGNQHSSDTKKIQNQR